MSGLLRSYRALCSCLSVDHSEAALSGLRSDITSGRMDWQQTISLANHEFVTPALWAALRGKGLTDDLPAPVAARLRTTYQMNLWRNQRALDEAAEAIGILNAAGIVPLILKGGAYLFDGAFADMGARVMNDIDLLVSEADRDRAIEALAAAGFRKTLPKGGWIYHQHAPLARTGGNVAFDVHRYVGGQRIILPVDEAFRDATRIDAHGVAAFTLSPGHRAFLNVFHAQISDRGYGLGIVWLRQLLDLARLGRGASGSVDWTEVRDRMDQFGMGKALRSWLHLAERLLAIPYPTEVGRSAWASLQAGRALLQVRWPAILWPVRLWATVTYHLQANLIDMTYRCGLNPFVVSFYRAYHALVVISRYRLGLFRKIRHVNATHGTKGGDLLALHTELKNRTEP